MQVVLLDKVNRLGNLGDVVKVKDGFARNFLIPKGRARRATPQALQEFEARRAELEKASADRFTRAKGLGDRINGTSVTISQKAGVDGRLFGSVTNHDIAAALLKQSVEGVHKSDIRMPNGPLKAIGEYDVLVALHADVVADLKVVVIAETE